MSNTHNEIGLLNANGSVTPYGSTGGSGSDVSSEVEAILNVYGSKNLFHAKATSGTWNGVTFTQNSDGSITITGTPNSPTAIPISNGDVWNNYDLGWLKDLNGKTLEISGVADYTESGMYFAIVIFDAEDQALCLLSTAESSQHTAVCNTNGAVYYRTWLNVDDTTKNYNITVYPMLRLSSIADDTYVPYAKTNRELTTTSATQSELSNLVLTGTTNTSGGTIASGTCFILNGDFVTAKADIASGATFTLNTNYEKKSVGQMFDVQDITSQITLLSAVVTGRSITVLKCGHLVQVIVQNLDTSPATGTGIALASGLPVPVAYASAPFESVGVVKGTMYIDANDNVLCCHHAVAGAGWGSMLYLTND